MYDLAVIGAGPGGYVSAIKAAQLGMKVALIEKNRVGGTCLNRGCIPTKTLLHGAGLVTELKKASKFGIETASSAIDFERLYQQKEQVVEDLVSGVERLIQASGITLIEGAAKITGRQEVLVSGEKIEAKQILIASGSVPFRLPIKGADAANVVTSDELLKETPNFKRLVIIGGGVIGVEFATIFQSFGCEVTIIEACDSLLPNFDKEISKKLAVSLKKQGIKIHTKAAVSEIQELEQGKLDCLFASKNKEERVSCDKILIAVGRKASCGDLFTDELSFAMERDGIKVDSSFKTSIPTIYAIGDVISGGIQLAHAASAQGVNAVLEMNAQEPQYDLQIIPSCVYTSPEIAAVGLDEQRAKAQGIPVCVGKYNMAGNCKSLITESGLGFIKIISHEQTGEILGAQMMCERATDMITQIAQMIQQKLSVHEAAKVIYPHPTYSEGISEALESTLGQAIHILPVKR